jgi:hypothetical protein
MFETTRLESFHEGYSYAQAGAVGCQRSRPSHGYGPGRGLHIARPENPQKHSI